jgi:broad specificity phosphatase PhoE
VGEIALVRHGETPWSATGRHTSYTDLDLTPDGERQARAVGAPLARRSFVAVLCSPRRRALRTAGLAGLTVTAVDDDLAEWNYGAYEGLTTAQIRVDNPGWDLWTDGCPGGETAEDAGARMDALLAERALPGLRVLAFGHGHALRVLAARRLGLPAREGRAFVLEPAGVAVLGSEHGRPAVRRWGV